MVQPYLYIATANRRVWEQMIERDREPKSIDEIFYERANERYETNSAFRALLATVCFECELFGYGACRVCVPTNAPSSTTTPASTSAYLTPARCAARPTSRRPPRVWRRHVLL